MEKAMFNLIMNSIILRIPFSIMESVLLMPIRINFHNNIKTMSKQISIALLLTIMATMLFSVNNIDESQNGYEFEFPYNHANYTTYQTLSSSNLELCYDENYFEDMTGSGYVLTSHNENELLSLTLCFDCLEKGDYIITLSIDDNAFVKDETITVSSTPLLFDIYGVSYGLHDLRIEVCNDDSLMVLYDNINIYHAKHGMVFQNLWGDQLIFLNQPSSALGKVALFVEGFDVSLDGDSFFIKKIAEEWIDNGLDDCGVAFFKFADATRDARDNAMSVLAATHFINNRFNQNRYFMEGISLFGFSMGGVISRYALAFAEDRGINHYCNQYISLDAPHRGAALNEDIQTMVKDIKNYLNSNWFMFNRYSTKFNDIKNQITSLNNKMESLAAKQLIRRNIHAEPSTHTYTNGSTSYLNFFSEINEEERDIYAPNIALLNYDSSYNNSKPGFPYKQNKISSMSYVNGSLLCSGETASNTGFGDYHIKIFPRKTIVNIIDQYAYDTQPGSVLDEYLPKNNDQGSLFKVEFEQRYAPVLVPTKSGLYLKENSVDGQNTIDTQFSISCFDEISVNTNIDVVQYLKKFTYFDEILYGNDPIAANRTVNDTDLSGRKWNHIHGIAGEVDGENMDSAIAWIKQIENRATAFITGIVVKADSDTTSGIDTLSINIQAYIENINANFPIHEDYVKVKPDGSWEIPYTLVRGSTLKLVFTADNHLPSIRYINVEYDLQNGAIIQPDPIVVMLQPASSLITVDCEGSSSHTRIQDAIDTAIDIVSSPDFAFEQIRINVMPGVYHEQNLDLTPLLEAGLADFELVGAGTVIIKGQNDHNPAINLDLRDSYLPEIIDGSYLIKNIQFVDCGTAIAYINECYSG